MIITVRTGQFQIDRADLRALGSYTWYIDRGHGRRAYVRCHRPTAEGGGLVYLHRLLMDCPDGDIDHRNGDTLDNRRSNLRVTDRSHNMANIGPHRDNRSGFKGVTRNGSGWSATIRGRYLGSFPTPEKAAEAYDQAAHEEFGEFAQPNRKGR